MDRLNRNLVKGFLHADGTKIVNGDGQEIILNGYGCGNWTNPEGFMVGAPTDIRLKGDIFAPRLLPPRRFDRRSTFDQVLRELCGTEYAKSFWPLWYRNHLGEADIRAMAQMGLNSVRLPINAVTLLAEEPGMVWDEDGFAMLDQVIDWCEKYRIYAILDLHAAPGGQSATACDGGLDNIPHLFIDDESWERALRIWERLAERYGDRWIVGGYDLLNEPVSLPNHRYCVPKLAAFYDEAIARIRKIDKVHMFTLEGSCFSRSNEIFDHDYDPECHNWCIHVHMYGASPEKKELYPYLLKGQALNVPVWIGEGASDPQSNAVFFQIAADYGIGFCLWCWKVANETDHSHGGMGPRGISYDLPGDWEAVRRYCAGGPKPSYERSRAIFDELLENIRYENCHGNEDYIRVTRRVPALDLPAVGYDNLPGDGRSFVGSWNYGNLLNYRLEDRTKLVWTPGIEEPRPGFDMYEDENIQPPFDPLKVLMLELGAGEYAVYTVREVKAGCGFSVTGRAVKSAGGRTVDSSGAEAAGGLQMNGQTMASAELEVWTDGVRLGTIVLGNALGRDQTRLTLPEGEEIHVKLRCVRGRVQLKMLHFYY